jgi:Tfp pilus assembly protein PilN
VKDKIGTYLNVGLLYYALEIHEHGQGHCYRLLEVANKKGELVIVGQRELDGLEELPAVIKKDRPLVLTLNTSGIITKIIPDAPQSNGEALVHNSFPNLDLEQFHYEIVQMEKGTLISICKKEQLNQILDQVQALKLLSVGFSLGICNLAHLAGFLGSAAVSLSRTVVTLENGSLTAFRPLADGELPNESTYDINGLEVQGGQLLNFGGILAFLFPQKGTLSNFAERKLSLKKEFRQKRHFNLILKASLLLVLGILFLNFLAFDHYFEKVTELRADSQRNTADKEQLAKIRERVSAKGTRMKAVLSTSDSRATYYLDRLARSVPNTLLLEGIQYQPLQRPLRSSKPVALEKNTILVSGSVSNNGDFSQWIETLEGFDWVRSVETEGYGYGNDDSSHFTLKISLYEDR